MIDAEITVERRPATRDGLGHDIFVNGIRLPGFFKNERSACHTAQAIRNALKILNKKEIQKLITFKKLHPRAKTPVRMTANAAGADVFATEAAEIDPGETVLVGTGIAIEKVDLDKEDSECLFLGLFARSGHRAKGVSTLGTGVIDLDYKGEIKAVLHNHGKHTFSVNAGDRIGQILLLHHGANILDVYVERTERGDGGFGSTGAGNA